MRTVKPFPSKAYPIVFETYGVDGSYHFSLFDLKVHTDYVTITIRTGRRILKWEFLRRKTIR